MSGLTMLKEIETRKTYNEIHKDKSNKYSREYFLMD